MKFEFEIWHFFVLVYLQLVIPAAPLSTLSHFHYYFYAIIMHWHTYFKTHTRVRTVGVGYYSVEETASSRVNFITKFTKANSLKSNNNTSNPTYMNIRTHTYTISQIYKKNNAILWYETFLFAQDLHISTKLNKIFSIFFAYWINL